jgi:hypothetical protein
MQVEDAPSPAFDYLSAQIGVASLLLGAIGLLFALSAIPIFLYLRYRAETVAREAAEEALNAALEQIEKQAISSVEAMLPRLTREYLELVKSSVSDETANEIAAAQEMDEEDAYRGGNPKGTG